MRGGRGRVLLSLSLLFLFMRYSGMLFTAYTICVDSKHKGRVADGPLQENAGIGNKQEHVQGSKDGPKEGVKGPVRPRVE